MLLCIVNCRQVVSVDAIWRQFLMGTKDLQFKKAMVQSLTPVGRMSILLWGMQNGPTYADFADRTGKWYPAKGTVMHS